MTVVPLFLSCCVLTSCAKPPATTFAQSGVHASFNVLHPDALANSQIVVKTNSSDGHPEDFDNVSASLTMTTMMMPPNVVHLVKLSPGVYAGTGTFTMGGAWSATVTATKDGHAVLIGTFPVSVKD